VKIVDIHSEQNRLIDAAIQGDRQAQKAIYNRLSPKMLSICRQYIKDVFAAEDVMISSFLKVFLKLDTFKKEGSFDGWVRRIMINECLSYIQANKKVMYVEESEWTDNNFYAIDSELYVEDLQEMIDELPEGCKVVFNLYAIEGYKHKEIAELLGIEEGTSKSQLSYARKTLQSKINLQKEINNEAK